MMNRCTEVHHVRAARGPRTSPRTPNARNAPRLGRSHGSPIPAGPAASVSRSRRRRSRLRARARGRARSIPTACRPRTTSAPPPLSPQGSCPVSASSSSPGLDSSWSESRNPSAFPAQRRARGRPRRSRPPTTHRTCRWGPWSSSEARSAPCRSSPSRPPWSWTPWSVQCRSSGLDHGGGLGLRRRRGLGDGRCGRRRRPGRRFGRARTRRQRHRPCRQGHAAQRRKSRAVASATTKEVTRNRGDNEQWPEAPSLAAHARRREVVRACIVLIEVAARRAGLNTRASLGASSSSATPVRLTPAADAAL